MSLVQPWLVDLTSQKIKKVQIGSHADVSEVKCVPFLYTAASKPSSAFEFGPESVSNDIILTFPLCNVHPVGIRHLVLESSALLLLGINVTRSCNILHNIGYVLHFLVPNGVQDHITILDFQNLLYVTRAFFECPESTLYLVDQ